MLMQPITPINQFKSQKPDKWSISHDLPLPRTLPSHLMLALLLTIRLLSTTFPSVTELESPNQ